MNRLSVDRSEGIAANRVANYAVVAGLAAWTAVLWPLHDLLPMWVEGMPAYLDQLLGVLRRACTPPINVIEWNGRTIPLAIDAYQGPLMSYLDVPVARAWLGSLTDDLYAYRYKGIVLLALSGFLMFVLLRRVATATVAALGTLVFVTLPVNAVTAIGDLQYHVPLLTTILATVAAFVRYAETRRPIWLVTATFAAGVVLLTRAEALIWTMAAGIAWLGLGGRALVRQWWATTPNKGWLVLAAMLAFLVGAAPIVVMNVRWPDYGLVGFLFNAPSTTIGIDTLLPRLVARGNQFVRFVLENRWQLYDVSTSHFAWVALASASIVALAAIAIRERRWPLSLVALVVVLPLSIISNRGPREIHLLPLIIPVVAVVAEVCGRLRPRLGVAVLCVALVANLVVGGLVLADWQALRDRKAEVMVSHSCPQCLAKALQPYRGASLKFTNVGLYHEALWASRAHACGPDILRWGDDPGFVEAVRDALDRGGRIVFVGYPKDREDAMAGRVLRRAGALAGTLNQAGVDYREERIAGPDGRSYYQLTIVDERPSRLAITGGGVNAPANGRITGWVLGRGFRPSDRLVVDGVTQSPQFANTGHVTFSVDAAKYQARDKVVVEMTSADGGMRSGPFVITKQ